MPTEPVILVILDASPREIGDKERSRRKIRAKDEGVRVLIPNLSPSSPADLLDIQILEKPDGARDITKADSREV
jgi:hypothetical protein